MSFTYGFYNSIEHDRLYDAIQVSKIFDGIIVDGVYNTVGDAFIVQASEEPDMVVVGPGRAWFNHTWNENDGYLDLELDAAETVLDRIDMIAIDVDERVQKRKNDILIIKGTPSSNPQKPTPIHELEHNQYPLAYVRRVASTAVITQSKIENTVGSSACPFVTGVLEGLDVDLMLLQWRSAWTEFLQNCLDHLNEWEDAVKEDVAAFVLAFKSQCEDFLTETAVWQTAQKESFTKFYNDFKEQSILYTTEYTDWVEHLKDILDEDAVGHLLLEIEKNREEASKLLTLVQEHLYGFEPSKTEFLTNGDILQTYANGSNIRTVFKSDGSIITTLKSSSDVLLAEKLTEFPSNTLITEKLIRGSYLDYMLSKDSGVGEWLIRAYGLPTSLPKLQTLNEIVNTSEEWINAIMTNDVAKNSLCAYETVADAFLEPGETAFKICVRADPSYLFPLLTYWWDKVVNNPDYSSFITQHRETLRFIFDDPTMQGKFMGNSDLLQKIRSSPLNVGYLISYTGTESFTTDASGIKTYKLMLNICGPANSTQWPGALKLSAYKWVIIWSLQDGSAGSSYPGYKQNTITIYPNGESGTSYTFTHNATEWVNIGPYLCDIDKGFTKIKSILGTGGNAPWAGDVSFGVAF